MLFPLLFSFSQFLHFFFPLFPPKPLPSSLGEYSPSIRLPTGCWQVLKSRGPLLGILQSSLVFLDISLFSAPKRINSPLTSLFSFLIPSTCLFTIPKWSPAFAFICFALSFSRSFASHPAHAKAQESVIKLHFEARCSYAGERREKESEKGVSNNKTEQQTFNSAIVPVHRQPCGFTIDCPLCVRQKKIWIERFGRSAK